MLCKGHMRANGTPLNHRSIFRAHLAHAPATPDTSRTPMRPPRSSRPSTSAPLRTPRRMQGPLQAHRLQRYDEQSDEYARVNLSFPHTPRLPTSPLHREDMNTSAGAHGQDERVPVLPNWQSVAAEAHSPDDTAVLEEERTSEILRRRRQSISAGAHPQDESSPSLPRRQSVSMATRSQNERATLEEEINSSTSRRRRHTVSSGAHSQDQQAPHESAIGNPTSRPRRRPVAPARPSGTHVAPARASTSVPVRVPAPVLGRASHEDNMQNQLDTESSYNLGSQRCESSSCDRCPVCTLPWPCHNHGHGDEDVPPVSRSVSSTDGAAATATAVNVNRARATRIAGSEISGMYRRPRRLRNSRVEDEPVSTTSVGTQSDAVAENDISRNHDASLADPVALHNGPPLSSRQMASPFPARNESPERAESRLSVPDTAASSSRRATRGRKKIRSSTVEPEISSKQALSSSDSIAEDDCPICLTPLVGKCVKTRCGHDFHEECLEQHLLVTAAERPTCPLCRGEIRLKLPVTAESMSGSAMEVLHRVPPVDSRCHLDRGYTFLSLGGFAGRPKMLYVRTSNEDKWTPAKTVMWTLTTSVPTTVYLNFRSIHHVTQTGAMKWLKKGGWTVVELESTVSTGWPNGPYEGPVFAKDFEPGKIELMGSNCHEGTYFVFVELRDNTMFDALPWDLSDVLA